MLAAAAAGIGQRVRADLLLPGGDARAAVDRHADRLARACCCRSPPGLASGEPLGALKLAGIALAVGGVMLAARRPGGGEPADGDERAAARVGAAVGARLRHVPRLHRARVGGRGLLGGDAQPRRAARRVRRRRAGDRGPAAACRSRGCRCSRSRACCCSPARSPTPPPRVEGDLSVVSVLELAVPARDRRARLRGRRARERAAGGRRRRGAVRDRADLRARVAAPRLFGRCRVATGRRTDFHRSEGEHEAPQDPWRNRHRDRVDRRRPARPGGGDGSAGAARASRRARPPT